jgi:23S rRNA (adenine2503-C2)-methyltransferase
LHAANNVLRNELVPINRLHPIEDLLEACWRYAAKRANRFITFEYVMLRDVNDSLADADDLARLLGGKPAKVNLIPFNPFAGNEYERSRPDTISAFQGRLRERGLISTTRRTRGDDIDAACGQLAGKVRDKVRVRLSEKGRNSA